MKTVTSPYWSHLKKSILFSFIIWSEIIKEKQFKNKIGI